MPDKPFIGMLGAFPPPVTGQAKNMLQFYEDIRDRAGVDPVQYNLSTGAFRRTFRMVLKKSLRYARYWFSLIFHAASRRKFLYIVSEGDRTLAMTLMTVLVGRLCGHTIILQHRSFAYINKYNRFMAFTNRALNARAKHVFLTEGMAARFFELYRPAWDYRVNHNLAQSALIWRAARRTPRRRAPTGGSITVGLLSNLMTTKGLDTFINVARRAHEAGLNARFELAGPAAGAAEEAMIDDAVRELQGRFVHHDSRHGDDKIAFLRGLDVFLFPTRYRFEAQPNVVLEALCCGCAVVSTDRGCIAEDLSDMGGWVVAKERAADPEAYFEIIKSLEADRAGTNRMRAKALCNTRSRLKRAVTEYDQFLDLFR